MGCVAVNVNHGLTDCGGHRVSCSTNRPLPGSLPTSLSGGPIYATQINTLKQYMNDELDRYRQHDSFASRPLITDIFNPNEGITSASWTDMATVFFNTTPTPAAGSPLNTVYWNAMLEKYDIIRQNCICNADCRCNNVCGCHTECCDYSDIRLKTEVTYC